MEHTLQEILSRVDHTLLKQGASWEQIRALCDEGMEYHTASVCIPPCYVRQASEYLHGRLPVCTVIGFPNGNATARVKCLEAEDAIANGADEIDMVLNVGYLKSGRTDEVREEIRAVKKSCGRRVLKVIIETCLLEEEEKITACRLVTEAGADFIKTSTGFSTGGATFEDVTLLRKWSGPAVRVKAAGGIASLEDADRMLSLGADRLGTSRVVKLAKEL